MDNPRGPVAGDAGLHQPSTGVTVVQLGQGQSHRLRTFLDWLKISVSPALIIPVLLIGGYHAMWALGGSRYDVPSAVAVVGSSIACVLLVKMADMLGISRNSGVKTFLFVAGVSTVVFAGILYLNPARMGFPSGPRIVSIAALLAGLLVLVAAANVREAQEPVVNHPTFNEQREIPLAAGSGSALIRTFRTYGGRGIDRILAAAESQLSTEDLHYIAYHVDGLCQFSIDVLDHPNIPADDKVTGDQRRAQYLRHGVKLNRLMVGLNQEFRSIDSGILLRVVLDVERGALYYFWVDDARFLIGVTMDQSQVHKADAKMVQLVDSVRPLLGHKRIEDLNR